MEKNKFFHHCEIKSGSGPGNEAAMSYSPEGERADVETIDNPCLQKTFLSRVAQSKECITRGHKTIFDTFHSHTAPLTLSSWDIPPSEELPPFSLRKALPTRNILARRRGSVCRWGPNWRSISITWLEERWENREHCWRFSRAPGGREGRGTPLAARGE